MHARAGTALRPDQRRRAAVARSAAAVGAAALCASCLALPPAPADEPAEPVVGCRLGDGGDGFDAPPGDGISFIADAIFAPSDESTGHDIDGDGTIDAALNLAFEQNMSGSIDLLNERIVGDIAIGQVLRVVEFAGLCQPFLGEDPAITAKHYDAVDADSPPDPSNNFCREEGCAEFSIPSSQLSGGQARYRSEPAPVRDHVVFTRERGPIDLALLHGSPFVVSNAVTQSLLAPALDEAWMLLGGVAKMSDLQNSVVPMCDILPLPGCDQREFTFAELLGLHGEQPDIDVDGDGGERFYVDADWHIASCVDGDGTEIPGSDCLSDPRIQDGFSVALQVHGIRAHLGSSP